VKLYWLRGLVLFLDFVIFVLAGRVGFSLKISEFDKVIEHKFCVSCVLMIHLYSFVFLLHIISMNNFQCKIIQ
jgi:hypothetical protein